jgi:hypothetical protein
MYVYYINFQLSTLRGTILELSIPSGAKTDTNKGIPPRDVVEYISQGEFATSCLKLAKSDKKVHMFATHGNQVVTFRRIRLCLNTSCTCTCRCMSKE